MDKKYKVVKQDCNNSDQYLIGFFETSDDAFVSIPEIQKKYSTWIKNVRDLHVKRVDPELIPKPVATDYAHYIRSLIPDNDWKRIMHSDAAAEINSDNNVCGYGGRTYYNLSKMIPLDWCVVDVGASYGCQSALFTRHKRYIAVEPLKEEPEGWHIERYQAEGTEFYPMTAGEFVREVLPNLDLNMNKTFAICNYVPHWYGENPMELVRTNFKNVFTFYP